MTAPARVAIAAAGRWSLVEERPDRDTALYMDDGTGTSIRTPVHPDLVPPLAVLIGDLERATAERDAAIARADFSDRAAEAYARVARLAAPPAAPADEVRP